jgi:hypothetical protein
MGCLLGGGVVPVAMAIMSSKTNKWAFIISMPAGLAAGLIAWLVAASVLYGELTVSTTGADYPMLAGNVASISVGALVCILGSLIWPVSYFMAVFEPKLKVCFTCSGQLQLRSHAPDRSSRSFCRRKAHGRRRHS